MIRLSLHVSFLGELDIEKLLSGSHHVLVLDSHDTTSPGSLDSLVLDEVLQEVLGELLNLNQILRVDISESNAGSILEVDKSSKRCLSANEAEWGSLASAKSWEMDHQFNWVDIMSNDNDLGLSFLNKGGHVVKTELEDLWLGVFVTSLTGLDSLSLLLETLSLGFLVFWGVFGEKFEEFRCY